MSKEAIKAIATFCLILRVMDERGPTNHEGTPHKITCTDKTRQPLCMNR